MMCGIYVVPRMWNIHKELFNTVESAISRKEAFAQQDLEAALHRHKPDFISLIQNPVSIWRNQFSFLMQLGAFF